MFILTYKHPDGREASFSNPNPRNASIEAVKHFGVKTLNAIEELGFKVHCEVPCAEWRAWKRPEWLVEGNEVIG